MKKKTLFRIAIQEFVDGKPKKYSNITIKEGDSFEVIHKKIDEKLINHLFKTKTKEEGELQCAGF